MIYVYRSLQQTTGTYKLCFHSEGNPRLPIGSLPHIKWSKNAQDLCKEMPDMNGTGEQKAYYKLKTWRKLDFSEFVKRCSSINRASLTGLSYSTDSRELLDIAADPASGIISQGRKSGKLYLPARKA